MSQPEHAGNKLCVRDAHVPCDPRLTLSCWSFCGLTGLAFPQGSFRPLVSEPHLGIAAGSPVCRVEATDCVDPPTFASSAPNFQLLLPMNSVRVAFAACWGLR